MALTKNPKFDLKLKFKRFTEIGLIFSLAIIIAAFKYFPDLKKETKEKSNTVDTITVDDIPITKHQETIPPPEIPKSPIFEESDDVLVDIEIPTMEIDVTSVITATPPKFKEDDEEDEIAPEFIVVEDAPKIIGGIEAVFNNLVYPELAIRANVEGTVVVYAYIDEKGNIVKLEIAKGLAAGCSEAALDAISKVKFTPGKQRGRAVKCRVAIPVRFKLK